MRVVSLFSGIEGFGLGLAMAGCEPEIILEAESEPFAQGILARRFPGVPILSDVREVDAGTPTPELLTAGFPCQPVSQAGRGRDQEDDRWLWPEVARIIGLLRPPRVLIENVRGLLRVGRGMGDVLRDLADLGYSAQWDLIPAIASGASHLRHRVWIVAYPDERPLGRVFDGPAWRFPFGPDPATLEGDARIPRLSRQVTHRRARLMALGNSVVPQAVASVALQVRRATDAEPLASPTLFAGDWPERFPKAGALLGGVISELPSTDPGKRSCPDLWPTPIAGDSFGARNATARRRDGSTGHSGTTLTDAVWLEEGVDPEEAERRPGATAAHARRADDLWPTPKASPSGPDFARAGRDGSGGDDLATAVARKETGRTRDVEERWPTPTVSDHKGAGPLDRRPDGDDNLVTRVARTDGPGGGLNPPWVEWLMGYPIGWTDPEA